MQTNEPKVENIKILQEYIDELRASLAPYFETRNRNFTSVQLFEFMTAVPTALVIALDGEIDEFEERVLKNMLGFAHRFYDEQLNEETHHLFQKLEEPEEYVRAFDFPEILNDEIHFVINNYTAHQTELLAGLKKYLELDEFIQKHNPMLRSLKHTVLETMYIIFRKNHGDDNLEKEGFYAIIEAVGIVPNKELIKKIMSSVN